MDIHSVYRVNHNSKPQFFKDGTGSSVVCLLVPHSESYRIDSQGCFCGFFFVTTLSLGKPLMVEKGVVDGTMLNQHIATPKASTSNNKWGQ